MMEKDQIMDLVMLAAGNDYREISHVNVEAWHKQFGGEEWLTYELAEDAVVRFYNAESRKIMAADILRVAREITTERLLETPIPEAVIDLAGEALVVIGGYDAIMQAARTAIVARKDPVAAARIAAAGLPPAITADQP
jgi:hypothetical protein